MLARPQASDSIYKIAIVAPTCFYYQVELFRALSEHYRIDLTIYFCSDEALNSKEIKRMYRSDGRWGMEEDLLKGYRYKFLKNFSPSPSYLRSMTGLTNFGIWREISRSKPDAVVLMSWMNPVWWIAVLACIMFDVPFLYLTDANASNETSKSPWKKWIKQIFLAKFIFKRASGMLCAGTANRLLYSMYGIEEEKLFPFAYSWGYQKILENSSSLKSERHKLRQELELSQQADVIIYCGRLSEEKGISSLIDAYAEVHTRNTQLLIVGDGPLRKTLENHANRLGLNSVRFMGFQDRNRLFKYYALADLLVLPSVRETWGLVINEALCFGLPVIASSEVGAGLDLVKSGVNGYTFPAGNSQQLADRLRQFLNLDESARDDMRRHSVDIIEEWSGRNLGIQFVEYLETINGKRSHNKDVVKPEVRSDV